MIDPLESIVRNTYSFVRRAEKNKAKLALVNLSRIGGAGEIFDEISKPNGATHTSITFYEDGKKKYLDTDRSIAKVVNNLSASHLSWYLKFIRIGTMLLRNFATVYNPAFALRNLVMDDQNAMLYSKYGLFSPADLVKGFLSVFNRDADFQEWMAMGGAQASFWSVDRDYTQASIDQLTKGKWGQYKSVKGFFKAFAVLGEYSELATRVAYYKKAKKALAAQNGGKIDRTTLITAALESRDLTDFARGGDASRTWNSLAAFANASIQGWDKFFRTFDPRQYWSKDKKVRQEWQRAMFRLAIGSILPTVLCFMVNSGGDDDWYEKDLPDWERQTHWCLGEHLRIPKGQDVGLRFFSNLTESILRSMAGDKKAFENWFRPLRESAPDWCPTALQPIFECMTNYDTFRKNYIVPQHQQKLPEYMQYGSRTSATAKFIGDSSLAKFIAGETGISPAKIDHFLYGYTGKMGREILRAGESIIGARNYDFKGISDIPLIGGFFRTPYIMPRRLTEFYDKLDEQTKLHNEFKMTKKHPEGYDHNLYTRLTNTQKEMRKFAKKEREIIDDPRLDFDVREERQNKLQKRRVEMAERALR